MKSSFDDQRRPSERSARWRRRSEFALLLVCGAAIACTSPGPEAEVREPSSRRDDASGASPPQRQVPDATFDTRVIRESSALQKSRIQEDVFWTLSDSGNSAEIFALDRSGRILRSFEIAGVENRDWESLALDASGGLYIGDIGNNANRRRDLVVYRVDEPLVDRDRESQAASLSVVEELPFLYAEQEQPPLGNRLDFDSEALFWARGNLYLLTKERTSRGTVLYRFDDRPEPAEHSDRPGLVGLDKLGRFEFGADASARGGTVTAADASEDGRFLAVLGYRAVFLFERPGQGDDYLAEAPLLRIGLSPGVTQQCEGIAWDGDDLLISNEQGELHRILAPVVERPSKYP